MTMPFPTRYILWFSCIALVLVAAPLLWWNAWVAGLMLVVFGSLSLLGWIDFNQKKQAVRRNYPVAARIRFLLESIRPEIRQYFLESDHEEIPFSRAQRSLVYQRSKNVVDKRAFGTHQNVHAEGYEWINHSVHTTHINNTDFRTLIGEHSCARPYSLSLFNISAMSFGALSGNAVTALNKGAKMGGFAQDTGEGSISRYHQRHGGDLIWEIGSGYFGCRYEDGTFNPEQFGIQANDPQVKMIEIKISQGAKPGHGGILPGAKVTAEIAAARGVKEGEDCVSPASHSAFNTPIELMEFIKRLRELSGGKPVGIKLCIGQPWEFFAMCKAMMKTDITPDYIVVDGAEGGTAAAPLEFSDHMGAPMYEGLLLVHNTLVGLNLRDRVKIGAAGKIISAFDVARALALGADWCNAGRGFMFSLGCIMAKTCHTGHCPTGVTTQDPIRQRGLDPTNKAHRVFHFHRNTMEALGELLGAAGLSHPSELGPHHISRRISFNEVALLSGILEFLKPGDLLNNRADHRVYNQFWHLASADSFAPVSYDEAEAAAEADS